MTMPRTPDNRNGAFAQAYDLRRTRRMTVYNGVDAAAADHLPACPRCHDLLPAGSTYCGECGTSLLVQKVVDGGDNAA